MSEYQLPLEELSRYLAGHLPDLGEVIAAEKFDGGQSNPSYRLRCSQGQVVLRSQPPGNLLKSAHQVDREFRVMRALKNTDVPVPQTYHLAEPDNPLGRQFFVMEYLEGRVLWQPTLDTLDREQRRAIYAELCRVLACIHSVDVTAAGLADYGRPGNYFERQVGVWSRNYRASVDTPDAGVERLIAWLEQHMPADDGKVSLVHGDYRLDNVMFQTDQPTAIGVLDWELSTLGHPLADLAYQCMQWRLPADGGMRGLGGIDRTELGIPSEQEYLANYCQQRGIDSPEHWSFYIAFSFFRLAAILQGVYRRYQLGNASNPDTAVKYGQTVPVLVELALTEIDSL
ncbi:MAG: phosphotransferase [Granulosicoccaceae bacterium]